MSTPKFTIIKWNAVALWTWTPSVSCCYICRNLLMENCIVCQASDIPAEECTVAWGICNHAFHHHCITRWLRIRDSCPLDDTAWEFQNLDANEHVDCVIKHNIMT
eukprot:TRINITY_DN1553_c0_g2_i1.p1 TRINITY_DN1553_c0_g2~~TRINITY_DN1553_c0_g2_i1.p1  ORF type:complete len:114 (-),score=9.99 TRINITY_DN1553_c0_g2_i1:95-409(-)